MGDPAKDALVDAYACALVELEDTQLQRACAKAGGIDTDSIDLRLIELEDRVTRIEDQMNRQRAAAW